MDDASNLPEDIGIPIKRAAILSLSQLNDGLLKSVRKDFDIVFVQGGDISINKEIVRYPVDFILDPVTSARVGVDEPTISVAKEKGVRFAYSLASLRDMPPFTRAITLGKMNFLNRLLLKQKWLPFVFSFARTSFELRDHRDLKALLVSTGIPEEFLSNQGKYLYEVFFSES